MQNMHLEQLFEDLDRPLTQEVDVLGVEARIRQKLVESIRPLVEQMEGDREMRAIIEVQ